MELKLDIPSDAPARLSVSERTAFADDDAHMVHFLKDLIQQKRMTQWCKVNGLDENQYLTIHEAGDLLTQENMARMLLRERCCTLARANLSTISRNCNVKYEIIKNITQRISKSNYPEKVWRSAPNAQTVCALSEYVPIDAWFVFPDELDEQRIKDMFDASPLRQ